MRALPEQHALEIRTPLWREQQVAVLRSVFRRALGFGALQDAVAEGLGSRQCVAAEGSQWVARSRGVLGSPEDLAEATRASRVWEFIEWWLLLQQGELRLEIGVSELQWSKSMRTETAATLICRLARMHAA